MKITDKLITKKEALLNELVVVKVNAWGSLLAMPKDSTDVYIQTMPGEYSLVKKIYKRIPESNCIIMCETGDFKK